MSKHFNKPWRAYLLQVILVHLSIVDDRLDVRRNPEALPGVCVLPLRGELVAKGGNRHGDLVIHRRRNLSWRLFIVFGWRLLNLQQLVIEDGVFGWLNMNVIVEWRAHFGVLIDVHYVYQVGQLAWLGGQEPLYEGLVFFHRHGSSLKLALFGEHEHLGVLSLRSLPMDRAGAFYFFILSHFVLCGLMDDETSIGNNLDGVIVHLGIGVRVAMNKQV